jgi:hypothetical protein
MDIHSDNECQKYWRDRFSEQIEECIDAPFMEEYSQQAEWFRQGLNYAMMIIRWDYDE